MLSKSGRARRKLAFLGLLAPLILLAGCAARSPATVASLGFAASQMPQPAPPLSLAVDTDGSLWKASGGLYRSADQGKTWQAVPIPAHLHPEDLREVSISPAAPFHVYAAGPGAGVLRSNEKREAWEQIGGQLPSQMIVALAAHSFRPDTVFAEPSGQGIFRTQDGGKSWEKMDDGPSSQVVALAHSTLAGSMNTGWLYAATRQGPYLSMDCF